MTLNSQSRFEQLLAIFFVIVGVALRLLPHPDNFTPITAIALFSGAVLAPGIALWLPLLVMAASDLVIGPHLLFPLTWGCFFLMTLIGFAISRKPSAGRIIFATVAGSTLFYLVTNLGVFLFQNMYEKSFAGLAHCYVMAIPFFRNAVLGDLFYSAVFFGAFVLVRNSSRRFVFQK
jgi:hypothetical protein